MLSTGDLLIDLDAIASNWLYLQEHVRTAQCAAVVKANAYGLGVIPVVKCLLDIGCQTYFVGTMDEAIEIRQVLGARPQIIVFGGQGASHCKECVKYQLTPVLVNYSQVDSWVKNSADVNITPIIKFDSGMHRFGLSPEDMDRLLSRPDLFKRLSPSYFMSHLACADTPDHPQNESQQKLFSDYFGRCKQVLPNLKTSLANSSACFLDKKYHFDLCRPGIALYGGNPTPTLPNPMQPVVQLHLPIMQVKTLTKGDAVGYGADFIAPGAMRIAIVFGGYADGLFRVLGGKGQGFIEGQAVPMVGRVSMDAIAFDVSNIDSSLLYSETSIELLGQHQSIDDLAVQANTISYEVLTSLGQRYQRRYVTA